MVIGEEAAFSVFQIENTNDVVFVNQRYRQLRARLRVSFDVTRVLLHVAHEHCLLLLYRKADDSFADRNVVLQVNILLKAQGKTVLQWFSGWVKQHDAEHLEI